MSKFSIIAKNVVLIIGTVGTVYAGNGLFNYPSTKNWTGLYAGGDVGLAFQKIEIRSQHLGFTNESEHCNTNSKSSTFFPGVQLGYGYQMPNFFVAGAEANIKFNISSEDTLSCKSVINPNVTDHFKFKNQIQTSIKGRFGRALSWNNTALLAYLTAGVSFADVGLKYRNEGGDHYSKKTAQAGWLIGTGVEWAIKKNWSLRAEYHYLDYGKTTLLMPSVYGLADPNGSVRAELSTHNFILALNYWI